MGEEQETGRLGTGHDQDGCGSTGWQRCLCLHLPSRVRLLPTREGQIHISCVEEVLGSSDGACFGAGRDQSQNRDMNGQWVSMWAAEDSDSGGYRLAFVGGISSRVKDAGYLYLCIIIALG